MGGCTAYTCTTGYINIFKLVNTNQSDNTLTVDAGKETRHKMKSYIEYPSNSDFPIENLPYGVFTSPKNVS